MFGEVPFCCRTEGEVEMSGRSDWGDEDKRMQGVECYRLHLTMFLGRLLLFPNMNRYSAVFESVFNHVFSIFHVDRLVKSSASSYDALPSKFCVSNLLRQFFYIIT